LEPAEVDQPGAGATSDSPWFPARAWQCDSVGQGGGGQDALAIALIHADCQQEEKTWFTSAVGIFNALVAARDGSINTADIADQ